MAALALRVHLSLDRHYSRQSVQYYSDMVDTPQRGELKEMKEEEESHEQRHEILMNGPAPLDSIYS